MPSAVLSWSPGRAGPAAPRQGQGQEERLLSSGAALIRGCSHSGAPWQPLQPFTVAVGSRGTLGAGRGSTAAAEHPRPEAQPLLWLGAGFLGSDGCRFQMMHWEILLLFSAEKREK